MRYWRPLLLSLVCTSVRTLAADQSVNPLAPSASEPATDWVDQDTGHRVICLSTNPNSSVLYFHDNAYTPQGDKLIFNTPNGVAVMDITHLGTRPPKLEIVTTGRGSIMARRTREVYVQRGGRGLAPAGFSNNLQSAQSPSTQVPGFADVTPDAPGARRFGGGGRGFGSVYAVNVDTKQERLVTNAVSTVINCDETYGFIVVRGEKALDPNGNTVAPKPRPYVPQLQRMFPGKKLDDLTAEQRYAVQKEERLARGALSPQPAAYTFINLKTGERKTCGYQYGNLNHQQFSPTNPNLLLYAHEGTWHEVDRTYTIRTDGSNMKLLHQRTMDMEINGHEWWSYDGKIVWFDLQTPRSKVFWLAGVNIDTGKETRYHIDRDFWGIHFNSSRDNTLFVSDGGDPSQVAYSTNGMWLNLFRVQPDGALAHEKLVNMSRHNYVTGGGNGGVEPNCSITPDKKWVVFTGQFATGHRHVYAVEIAKMK